MKRKLFVTELLLAPKSDKLFRMRRESSEGQRAKKHVFFQVHLLTFCFAYERYVAVFVNNHVR